MVETNKVDIVPKVKRVNTSDSSVGIEFNQPVRGLDVVLDIQNRADLGDLYKIQRLTIDNFHKYGFYEGGSSRLHLYHLIHGWGQVPLTQGLFVDSNADLSGAMIHTGYGNDVSADEIQMQVSKNLVNSYGRILEEDLQKYTKNIPQTQVPIMKERVLPQPENRTRTPRMSLVERLVARKEYAAAILAENIIILPILVPDAVIIEASHRSDGRRFLNEKIITAYRMEEADKLRKQGKPIRALLKEYNIL